jgi:hypothetical protein
MSTTPRFGPEAFRKSSYSEPDKACVEIAREGDDVAIRDSKKAFGSAGDAHLGFTSGQLSAFLSAVRKGTFSE